MSFVFRFWVGLSLFVAIVYGNMKKDCEHFRVENIKASNDDILLSNRSTRVIDKHPIQSVDVDLETKYPLAYYSEMDNVTFTNTLSQTFSFQCSMDKSYQDQSQWSDDVELSSATPPALILAYEAIMRDLERKVQQSDAFIGAPDRYNTMQMVHNRFVLYRISKEKNNAFMLLVEFVLYRDSKSHGKHYSAWVTLPNFTDGAYAVVQLKFKGVVFEDAIGMFPVEGVQPLQPQYHEAV